MLNETERRFLDSQPVGRLATADAAGRPHVVPVCFAVAGDSAYVAIDAKPKRGDPLRLKRLRNIAENPFASLVVDRYADDWSRLGWVLLHGRAEILTGGVEHAEAQALVRARYPQMREMDLTGLPVIALRLARAGSWGDLTPE